MKTRLLSVFRFLFFLRHAVPALPAFAGIHTAMEVGPPILDGWMCVKDRIPLLGATRIQCIQLFRNSGLFRVQVSGTLLGSHGNGLRGVGRGNSSGHSSGVGGCNSGHGEYSRVSYPF